MLRDIAASVHPHACGEHSDMCQGYDMADGSSPRLWGTLCYKGSLYTTKRFIPTPVGNIYCKFLLLPPSTVHPHACGEHIFNLFHIFTFNGSSPRLWGTFLPLPGTAGQHRFIPTPVGNIAYAWWRLYGIPVHPHACGEHIHILKRNPINSGSSPRLWGTFRYRLFHP